MDDHDFVAAFEACTLPASEFSHRSHVRLAWLYLRDRSLLEALPHFSSGLKRYAASLGAAGKYHETITWAYLFLIHERMQSSSWTSFDEFAEANEDLFGPILKRYYSKTLLESEAARHDFILPDQGSICSRTS